MNQIHLRLNTITVLLILSFCKTEAQQPVFTLKSQPNKEVIDYYTLPNRNIYVMYRGDGVNTPKTSYTVFNTDFDSIKTYTSNKRYRFNDIIFQSANGSQFLCEEGKGLIRSQLWGSGQKDPLFSDEDFNEAINEYSMVVPFVGKEKYDVSPISFIMDTHLISIGRKEGKENYKKGVYKNMAIFMLKKPLNGGTPEYIPINPPKGNYFAHFSPNFHYADNDFFILIFNYIRNDRKHVYRPVYYDYNGNILKHFKITLEAPNDKGDFGILNLGSDSFTSYMPTNSHGQNTQIIPYRFATDGTRASMVYDYYTDSFYVYGSIDNKKGNDGLLLTRYDNEGNQLWQRYQEVPESSFHFLNSFNRHLKITPTNAFVGMRLYSVKGKHYNHLYLFDINTGETKAFKYFDKGDYKKSGLYNTYSAMMGVYSETFSGFVKNFEFTKTQNEFEYGYFTKDGFISVLQSKKDDIYTFYKFEF